VFKVTTSLPTSPSKYGPPLVLMVAAFIMCLAVVLASVPVFVGGAVVAVVGLVAGKLLSLAGYGAVRQAHEPADAR